MSDYFFIHSYHHYLSIYFFQFWRWSERYATHRWKWSICCVGSREWSNSSLSFLTHSQLQIAVFLGNYDVTISFPCSVVHKCTHENFRKQWINSNFQLIKWNLNSVARYLRMRNISPKQYRYREGSYMNQKKLRLKCCKCSSNLIQTSEDVPDWLSIGWRGASRCL